VAAPVENLAASLRRLAAGVAAGQEPAAAAAAVPPATAAAPPELRQLQEAFTILGRELAESRRQLTRAVQLAAVGRLAAVVVHEIRNPLSGIKMNAQILAGAGPAPADPSLTHILREIDRLDLFLQELLALAQGADAGPVPAAGVPAAERPAAGDAGEVAQAVLATLRPKLERAGVAVTTAFPNPCRVAADERRLRQIWLNLILNALDAMPQGGQLQLGAAPDPADARRWRCELRDSGPGVHLPPGQEPFAAFVTGKPHGTGLGLFVCARLAESLGGAIGYENPPGGGARFWFTLPRG
jgi:signal transduction histidine kinase